MCIILGLLAAMVLRYSIKTFSEVTFVDFASLANIYFVILLIYLGDSTYMRTCVRVCNGRGILFDLRVSSCYNRISRSLSASAINFS